MKLRGAARWRMILLAVVLAGVAAAGWLWFDFARFAGTPLALPQPGQSIDVARGVSFRDIVADLRKRGATSAPSLYWRGLALQMRRAPARGRVRAAPGHHATPAAERHGPGQGHAAQLHHR
jgi:UPF0755 protein